MPISPPQLLLELRQKTPQEARRLLTDFIRALLVDFLELDALEEVAPDQSFAELGTDSMQATEFKLLLEKPLACKLKTTLLFDYPRLDLLVDFLMGEVLETQTEIQVEDHQETFTQNDPIVVVAFSGVFPETKDANTLWQKVLGEEVMQFDQEKKTNGYAFGRIQAMGFSKNIASLGLKEATYLGLERQEKLVYQTIGEALINGKMNLKELSRRKTGVYLGANQLSDVSQEGYQVPLPNKVSFQLNLQGPSEIINTFCTSVYVALHRAIQSIQLGECEQALVGGINLISEENFKETARKGLYDDLLDKDNCTRSFNEGANGFARSEGAGMLLIKPLSLAIQDQNIIQAIIQGSAVYHGGRGYSLEAPNAQGMRETIGRSLSTAGISTDTIDYVEAHGIGNPLADALELSAIQETYAALSQQKDKKWFVSSVKPTVGHPEIAAGMASLIKAIQAIKHQCIPGIAGFDQLNAEALDNTRLRLQHQNQSWESGKYPRRVGLNSYAIGGVNAHVVLEEYTPGTTDNQATETRPSSTQTTSPQKNTFTWSQEVENRWADLLKEVFALELTSIDLNQSPIHYGFDSIKVMQLVRRANDQFDQQVKIGQVLRVNTFQEFFELFNTHQATQEKELPLPDGQTYPISEVQKGLWFIQEMATDSTHFNVPIVFKSTGSLNVPHLSQAFTTLLNKHPVLRLSFVKNVSNEEITQTIHPIQDCQSIKEITLSSGQDIQTLGRQLLRQPFNLSKPPLIRLFLINDHASSQQYVLFIIHHIVIDGMSGVLLMQEFWKNYESLCEGIMPKFDTYDMSFFDFVQWERNYLNSAEGKNDAIWWKENLQELAPSIRLPYDQVNMDDKTAEVGCKKMSIQGEKLNQIKELARTQGMTVSVLLLAIFKVFIHKISQERNIAVTTPVEGRPQQAFENSMGCYIKVMVTKTPILPEQRIGDFLQVVKEQFINGLDHVHYPFSRVVSELGLNLSTALKDPKQTPLPVSYTYQNIFEGWLDHKPSRQNIEPLYDIFQETGDNYTLEVYDWRDTLQVNFKYRKALFYPNTIQQHLLYFDALLTEIVANPLQIIAACQEPMFTQLPHPDNTIKPNKSRPAKSPENLSTESRAQLSSEVNPVESALVAIWAEILELDKTQISVYESFIDLGGHSLLAIQIMLRINKTWKQNLSLNTLFEAENIHNLAQLIDTNSGEWVEDTLHQFEEDGKELTI